MGLLNIAGDPNDASYRYKMPPIETKVEGRGNGIKTRFVNIKTVSKSLERDPACVTKFFGCEFGAVSNYNEGQGFGIVNGAHDNEVCQKIVFQFIKKFILCSGCNNPETRFVIEDGNITMDCIACGHNTQCDMRHRLASYILSHPPPGSVREGKKDKKKKRREEEERARKEAAKLKEKEEKKLRKQKEREEKEAQMAPEELAAHRVAEEKKKQDKKDKKKAERKAEKKAAKEKAARKTEEESEDDDDVEWFTDTSKEAVANRMDAMVGNDQKLADMIAVVAVKEEPKEEESEEDEDPVEVLTEWLAGGERSVFNLVQSVKSIADEYELNEINVAQLIYEAIFGNGPVTLSLVEKWGDAFATIVNNSVNSMRGLCIQVEKHCVQCPANIPKVPRLLQMFFDEEVLTEEGIEAWYSKPNISAKLIGSKETAEKIRETCKPLMEWLAESDEESDE
eukprot:TRINITY_DN435_c0_g1_i5.p1 TRINITY_DN435_c0_g1~~TRINITY_DN435_c0_g1_i5.p1  ORF type:complete len:452 (-),score=206.59 TRINITY_DN435_c0_g1_i5:51-1406(-)